MFQDLNGKAIDKNSFFFSETHFSQNFPLFEKSVFHQKRWHQRIFLPAFYSVSSPANSY